MKRGQRQDKQRARALSLEHQELKAEIDQIRHKMESVRSQFEEVVDPTLIDCYIYELKAVQLRYQFLLRRFKLLEKVCAADYDSQNVTGGCNIQHEYLV